MEILINSKPLQQCLDEIKDYKERNLFLCRIVHELEKKGFYISSFNDNSMEKSENGIAELTFSYTER